MMSQGCLIKPRHFYINETRMNICFVSYSYSFVRNYIKFIDRFLTELEKLQCTKTISCLLLPKAGVLH